MTRKQTGPVHNADSEFDPYRTVAKVFRLLSDIRLTPLYDWTTSSVAAGVPVNALVRRQLPDIRFVPSIRLQT